VYVPPLGHWSFWVTERVASKPRQLGKPQEVEGTTMLASAGVGVVAKARGTPARTIVETKIPNSITQTARNP
jgi:hypothetical protein